MDGALTREVIALNPIKTHTQTPESKKTQVLKYRISNIKSTFHLKILLGHQFALSASKLDLVKQRKYNNS